MIFVKHLFQTHGSQEFTLEQRINWFLEEADAKGFIIKDIKFTSESPDGDEWGCIHAFIIYQDEE